MLLWSCKERSAILLFTQFQRIWDKKKPTKLLRSMSSSWTFRTVNQRRSKDGSVSASTALCWLLLSLWAFPWHLFWMTAEEEGEEGSVRGSWSHINSKNNTLKISWKRFKGCRQFSVTWVGFKFPCSALLIKQYFGIWSSVYLQLLQYFVLLFATFTVINYPGHKCKWLRKKKEYVKVWGNASLCSSLHLCHTF